MNIFISEHRLQLNETQRDYIRSKVEHVEKHLGKIYHNEAAETRVNMIQEDTKDEDDRFICEITLTLPGKHILRCDERAMSPEAAMDTCIEKLEKQIEKFRTKLIG